MIEHYTDKVIEVMGWPEWEGAYGIRCYLTRDGEAWAMDDDDGKRLQLAPRIIAPHVALCIWRDWARAHLRKLGMAVQWAATGERWYITYAERAPAIARQRLSGLVEFTDEDEALATAALASGEKE